MPCEGRVGRAVPQQLTEQESVGVSLAAASPTVFGARPHGQLQHYTRARNSHGFLFSFRTPLVSASPPIL
jgi:hypothetical protein